MGHANNIALAMAAIMGAVLLIGTVQIVYELFIKPLFRKDHE